MKGAGRPTLPLPYSHGGEAMSKELQNEKKFEIRLDSEYCCIRVIIFNPKFEEQDLRELISNATEGLFRLRALHRAKEAISE